MNRNIVRGVQPAGQIWVIRKLEAEVKTKGKIEVEGEGLVLGGGNNVGRATGQNVFATLICEVVQAPRLCFRCTARPSLASPRSQRELHHRRCPVAGAPDPCANPVLLIRNAANSNWFAAGILKSDDSD